MSGAPEAGVVPPEAREVLAELDERHRGYLQRPLPDPLDGRIGRLVQAWIDAPEPDREALRAELTLMHAQFLEVYAERMASLAVHLDSTPLLVNGLVGLGLAAGAEYEKEILVLLPLFARSAERLEADPHAIFAEASAHLGPTVPEWLRDFPERSPELRRVEAMGYEERESETGLLYARTW